MTSNLFLKEDNFTSLLESEIEEILIEDFDKNILSNFTYKITSNEDDLLIEIKNVKFSDKIFKVFIKEHVSTEDILKYKKTFEMFIKNLNLEYSVNNHFRIMNFDSLEYFDSVNKYFEVLAKKDFLKLLYLINIFKRVNNIPIEFLDTLLSDKFLETFYYLYKKKKENFFIGKDPHILASLNTYGKVIFNQEAGLNYPITFEMFYHNLVITNFFMKKKTLNIKEWYEKGFLENINNLFLTKLKDIKELKKYYLIIGSKSTNSLVKDKYFNIKKHNDIYLIASFYVVIYVSCKDKIKISEFILNNKSNYWEDKNTIYLAKILEKENSFKMKEFSKDNFSIILASYFIEKLGFSLALNSVLYIVNNFYNKTNLLLKYIEYVENTEDDSLNFALWHSLFYKDGRF